MMAAFVPKVMSFIVRRSTTTGHSSSGPAAAAWKCTRYISSPTFPLLEKRTMKVPSMGDSITEGTIVEWTAEVGQAVKDGDVVALVETDKVTVEIKAVVDGVITQRFGSVDDTVEVGANLYEVDTDAETSFEASTSSLAPISNSSAPPSLEPAGKKESIEAKSYSAESAHRSPLIKFLGKEGWEAARRGSSPTPALSVTPTISISLQSPHAVTKISHNAIIHPMYGRPRFTAAEMEALLTGGATTAPTVLLHSSGATFKQ